MPRAIDHDGGGDAIDIKALDADGIERLVADLGEPHYRARQIVRWLHGRGATSFSSMTDIPQGLRERLAGLVELPVATIMERQISRDGTRKYLVGLGDGMSVECVGLPSEGRLTVCFSTQAGCAMGCAFCATGRTGLQRSLGAGEMVDQVRLVANDFGMRATGAVAMGQGEPFAAYDQTMGALRLMNSPDGLGIGARHLTVSTCGLIPGIERFSAEREQFTLAVSLHSAVQSTRDQLMPGLKGMPLPDLKRALIDYAQATGRRPSLEYALMEDLNDSSRELAALVDFCSGLLIHVNLIPANPVDGAGIRRSPQERLRSFVSGLTEAGIPFSIRTERGADISAACGQLRQRSDS